MAAAPHAPVNYLPVRPEWLARRRALSAAWRPYIETAIEAFGAERAMFESNFPVDKGSYSYGVGWNALKRLAQGASAVEKTALFSATATRFYRLDESP